MPGFLFHDVIFGPVRSRRLGLSLGVNLLPLHVKHCSFNCIYCECGWTPRTPSGLPDFPSREEVREFLGQRLEQLAGEDYLPDAITYAGNGEPTLHPDFPGIVDDTIALRNLHSPGSRVSVLSNASMIHDPAVFSALLKLDNNIQKLDAGSGAMLDLINNPPEPVDYDALVNNLERFGGRVTIQSMFLRGSFKGNRFDNTEPGEVASWLERIRFIRPKLVMLYPIARATPVHDLEKITIPELEIIAQQVRAAGIPAQVYP